MNPKQLAGEAALEFLHNDMIVGLGTGSTADFFIAALGNTLKSGKLKNVRGVPTSIQSERRARALNIPLIDVPFDQIEVAVDGADEIDPQLNLIKGLGGALLREKIVAQNSKKLIIIADASKSVPKLGSKAPLPVEVAQFAHEANRHLLESLGAQPVLRTTGGKTYITDNGNFIYDCKFPDGISDPQQLNQQLKTRAGIVESGLFLGITSVALIADGSGVRKHTRP